MAQTNIYLKLDDIKGESLDENHEEWIELDTFTWGVDNQANFAQGQGGQATQSKTHGISVTKVCDKLVGYPMAGLHHRQTHSQRKDRAA